MKISSKFSLALLAGTILSTPTMAAAATLTPTLDTIKAEAADLSGNFALSKLDGDLQEGAVEVEIAGVKYYFTPTGEDAALLKTLAGTVAGNLKEDENGIFEFDGKKYSFNTEAIPASVFEYVEGKAEDYNFTMQEADAEGNITTKYYKVVLKPENFATSESIKWSTTAPTAGDTTGSVAVKLPNNQMQTFYYAYNKPADYTETGTRIDNTLGTANVTGVVFKDISSSSSGGAIYNTQDHGDINITADFIGNYVNGYYVYGGAISNYGTIGNITGDFIGNYAYASGGAIYNGSTISSITGDFIGNYVSGSNNAYGGAIYNFRTIGNITADFIGNYAQGRGRFVKGGAIYNSSGTIGDITGDFIRNYAESAGSAAYGGAISNEYGTIGNITGDFIGNYVSGSNNAYGGAILNGGTIGNITGNFIGNYTDSADGGAIHNGGTINNITGDFIGNYADEKGGAIHNGGTINNIIGDFIGNYAGSGGAISIYTTNTVLIGNITGNFTGNHAGRGGAISSVTLFNGNSSGAVILGNITGDFIENYAQRKNERASGGAIYNGNDSTIRDITGDFIGNYASSDATFYTASGLGGAIYNRGTIGDITGDFIGNYAESAGNAADGGAIYNDGTIGDITGDFIGNYAQATSTLGSALGGAVFTSDSNITFTTKGKIRFMSGNYTSDLTRGKNYNAVFAAQFYSQAIPTVTFDTSGGGAWIINDGIDGGKESNYHVDYSTQYNLSFRGDDTLNDAGRTTQYIAVNNDIINAGEVSVEGTTLHFGAYQHEDTNAHNWDGQGRFLAALNADGTADLDAVAVTKMSLTNAAFDIYNGYRDTVNLAGWNASNGYLHIDVDTDNLTADVLNITGDVAGQTKVIVYASSTADITGKSILFATATGAGSEDSFSVYRVYNSPYMFDVTYNPDGTTGKEWSLTMNDEKDNEYAGILPDHMSDPEIPDIDDPDTDIPTTPSKVYAEIVAYGALPAAALEQTRNMVDNIGNQIKNNRAYTRSCSFVDGHWNGEPYHNLWVNPTYYTSNIDSPFAIDADIWGIEAGGDIQRDINNRLGIFVSYRQGEYDMDGSGDSYRSPVGSEIDIDSYIAGLYYRYDHNNWYAFATLYGGIQEADIKTDDGMKSDTDGVEFGASIEGGYDYALTDSVSLTPELGVFYTQVNYDDVKDSMGKSASYDDARQIELEAGIKLSKTFVTDESIANVYVKPSVVQTIVDGDEVSITGLSDVEALDDATLGRIEISGRYGFTTNLSAYGWANYTFGSDYDATTFGLGLNYAF